MKNIYKKVLTLAMGLLLTVSAGAQVNHFVKNDAAKRAIIENMDKNITLQASDAKVASVTITADSTTASTAYLRFDMNDETAAYVIVLDQDGLIPLLMAYGIVSDVNSAVVMMYQSGYYDAIAYNDTTMTVTGYLPGFVNTIYALAFDANQDYAVSQGSFTMATQGGTGTALVALSVTDVTSTTMNVATTMNDQTNIYYFAMAQSFYYADSSDEVVIRDLMAAGLAYAQDLSYMEEGLLPSTEYTYFVYPLNADGDGDTLTRYNVTTVGQGGEGTATVTVTIGNATNTTFDVSATMGDETNLYYLAYADSTWFAGMTPEEIAVEFRSQLDPMLEDLATTTISDLTPGTTYGVYAFPYNNNNELGTPSIQYIRTIAQGGDGEAVVELTLSNVTSSTMDFALTMNDQTNYYYFVYGEKANLEGITQEEVVDQVVNSGSFSAESEGISGQLPFVSGTAYLLFILPYNANGELGRYDEIEVMGGQGRVSINDANGISYSIYPNPATSVLNVEGENIDRVEMYNTLGQQVMASEVNGTAAQFDVNSLTKGAYILKVYSNGQESVQKVVVK